MKKAQSQRLSYSEKLKDPRWQRKRLEIMGLNNFKCEQCESVDKTLNVHHIIYKKGAEPWEYENHELQCLCNDCHIKAHKLDDALNDAFAKYKTRENTAVLCDSYVLLGFLQAAILDQGPVNQEIEVLNYEHAEGIAKYFNLHKVHGPELIIDTLVNKKLHYQRLRWAIWPEYTRELFMRLVLQGPQALHGIADLIEFWPEDFKREAEEIFQKQQGQK